MVSLGFIKNSEQCPQAVRQVRVLRSPVPLPSPGEATVRIWHDRQGLTRWGFDWGVWDTASYARWAALLAARIIKLGWNAWWLDVACLSKTLNLPVEEALGLWGASFWDAYAAETLVLLDVGQQRKAVYQAVRCWENQFAWVRFSSGHDYDNQPLAHAGSR